jgi:hypothetical protein
MENPDKAPKKYLYHMVPNDMTGSVLHPLNTLKDSHPDLYVSKASKYKGREHLMNLIVPTLECKWNDVLQFSPIHPQDLKKAFEEAGMKLNQKKFFQIDPELLDPEKTTIYLFNDMYNNQELTSSDFQEYHPDHVAAHSAIKDITRQYWKAQAETEGGKVFLFMGIPHILHKGSIDVSELPVIVV